MIAFVDTFAQIAWLNPRDDYHPGLVVYLMPAPKPAVQPRATDDADFRDKRRPNQPSFILRKFCAGGWSATSSAGSRRGLSSRS